MNATPFQQACGAATYDQGFDEGQSDRRNGRRLSPTVQAAGSDEWQMGYADGWDLCPEGDPDCLGPGRPRIGERIHVVIPDGLLATVDRYAALAGIRRAEAIRILLAVGLDDV